MSSTTPHDEGIWPNDVLARGTTINGYRIVRLLGRGGFGVTYLAEDLLGQNFAIKEYFPRQFAVRQGTAVLAASGDEAQVFDDCRTRFVHEARALVGLGRSRAMINDIVRVQTFFEANGTAYMVMEYIVGRTLQAMLRDHPRGLPEPELRRILGEILAGLSVVHTAGLMHRDIKPANILLRDGVQAVLIDFGSSREAGGQQTQGFTQIFSGGYAPPEQITGARQGPWSDLYAVGAIGYEAIGGKVSDAVTRQHAVALRTPDPMPSAATLGAGRYTPALLAVIDQALALDPAQRPASAAEMAALIRNPPAAPPVPAAPPPPPKPTTPPPPKPAPATAPAPAVKVAPAKPAAAPKPAAPPPAPPGPPGPRRLWPLLAGAGAATIAVGIGAWFAFGHLLPGAAPPPPPPQTTAAIPARLPPAPPPQDGLAEYREASVTLPCALLTIAAEGNAIRISGRANRDPATDAFLARVRTTGRPVQIATEPLDPALCGPIPALSAAVRRAREQAPLQLDLLDTRPTAGAPINAMLQGNGGGMLQVDLFGADGSVRHIQRPRPQRAGQWTNPLVLPAMPAGTYLLVAIASTTTLDLGQRMDQERPPTTSRPCAAKWIARRRRGLG